jgi:hypothetical protein
MEIAAAELRWLCARSIQRVFRGLQGRRRFKAFKAAMELMKRHRATIAIQRSYRGYCGRLLAAVAKALRKLRSKHQYFALEMQRFVRGCVGRHHFKVYRELAGPCHHHHLLLSSSSSTYLPTYLPTYLQGA